MDNETKKKQSNADRGDAAGFARAVLGFASEVLESIGGDDLLRVLWGVEVLLFAILVLALIAGGLSADQRLLVTLVVAASVVVVFLVTTWRVREHRDLSAAAVVVPTAAVEQARRCRELLEVLQGANQRVLDRGRSGAEPWSVLLRDRWNRVCDACEKRRLDEAPPDPYIDRLRTDPDVERVCQRKWELGEAVDDYRDALEGANPAAREHVALQRRIRRSITQPDLTPEDLARALAAVIEQAVIVLER